MTDHRAFWQYLVARLARTRFEVRPWLDPDRQCFEGRSKRISRSFDDGRFLRPARAEAMVKVHGVGNTTRCDRQGQHRYGVGSAGHRTYGWFASSRERTTPEQALDAGGPPQFGRAHLVFGPQHHSDGLSGTSQGDHCSAALVHAQRQLL
jgi:hypothetical protein